MTSNRYNSMLSRCEMLRRLLIPATNSTTGNYKRVTKEKSFAYSLLMHAEIESYIEDMISDIANAALDAWKSSRRATPPLISMLAHKEGNEIGFSDDVFNISPERKIDTIIYRCKQQFDARLHNNNGVRRKNITKLMMSIGFFPESSDEALLSSLDGFGAKRGDYAHKSPDHRLLRQTDPITEANEIRILIENMRTFDEAIISYKLSCGL